jgi:hypothetical protein
MDFLKSAGVKIVAGIVSLAVIAGGISWYRMNEATRGQVVGGAGLIFGWIMIVLLLPWATFFLIGRVARLQSNLAGGMLVLGYTLAELLGLCWMFGWAIHGGGPWTAVIVGVLFAAVYNVLTCDWIAEKVEG